MPAAVWLVVLLGAVYFPLFRGEILFYRDVARWAYPGQWFLREAALRGEPPFWNPNVGLGFPVLLETVYGFFYPGYLPYRVLPLPQGVTWIAFAHVVLGGLGALALARRLGASPAASLVAGLGWSLSGAVTSLHSIGALAVAGAFLPWCGVGFAALAHRARQGGRGLLVGVAAAAVPVALCASSGEVFLALIGAGFGLAVALAIAIGEAPPRPDGTGRRLAAGAFGAGLLAAGLAAAAVLPAAAVANESERAAPLPAALAEESSLHPLSLLEIGAAASLGRPYEASAASRLVADPARRRAPFFVSFYAGATMLGLAAVALGRRRPAPAVLALVGGFAILLALGGHTPVHAALRRLVPPLAYMRDPQKYLLVFTAVLAPLAALGFDRLLGTPAHLFRRLLVLVGFLAVVGVLAGAVLPPEFGTTLRGGALRSAAIAAGLLLAIGAERARPRLGARLLLALVAVDLASAAWPVLKWASPELLTLRPPAARRVLEDAQVRALAGAPRVFRDPSVDPLMGELMPVPGLDAAELRSMASLAHNTASTFGIGILPGSSVALPPLYHRVIASGQGRGVRLFRLLGAGYAVLPNRRAMRGVDPSGLEFMMDPMPGARLFRVRDPLPRVYVAGAGPVVTDEDLPGRLLEPDVVGGDVALVAPGAQLAPALHAAAPGRAGSCTLAAFRTDRVEAHCRLDRPGLVVFVEQYAAGWTASLDGAPAPLVRANGIMRAVSAPVGEHHVRLTFRPPGFVAGIVVSLVSLASLVAVAAFLRLGRRKPHERATR